MTYNKSEIMKHAWRKARALGSAIASAMGGVRALFAQMLKQAWANAKAAKPVKLTREQAAYRLMLHDNKTYWNSADYHCRDELALAARGA